jgi:Flp pilus assembly pilin Flp
MEFVLIVILFSLFLGLIQGFVYYLIVLKGMNYYKIKTAEFNAVKYVKLIVLGVFAGILALISYHEKKFFFAFLGTIGLYVLAVMAGITGQMAIAVIFLFTALIATFIYVFIVVYNSIRLSMSPFVFLEKNQGIFESIRESWNLTQGKVIEVLIATVIVGIIVMVVAWISGYLGEILAYAFFPELMNPTQTDPLIVLSMLKQNLGLMTFVSGFPAIIAGMIMEVFAAYCYAGIYFHVRKKAI